MLDCHILDSGYTTALEALLMRGGRLRRIACHSLAVLLIHQRHGSLLFDAGYAPRILQATKRFPYRIYRWVTPLHVRPEQAAARQVGMLAQAGRAEILFAADGCWLSHQIREKRRPHPITSIIADDMRAVSATINGLHTFAQARPDVRIIPCHCPEAFAREVRSDE